MRILMLTLAIALATGCAAERPPNDAAATPAPAPTSPPPTDAPPPADDTPPADTSTTVAARFQGRYATDAAACAAAGHESRLTIESSRIAFHESSGPITRVSQGHSEATITANLTGEGETREATYSFRLSDDGNTLTDVGNGVARRRCG